jgi:hypothetical protein
MTKDSTTRTHEPHDRLTRVADTMLATFGSHAEKRPDDRAIVFLNDNATKGGIALSGYSDDTEAIADLLIHLRALFRARGQELHIVPAGMTPPKDRV